MMYILKEIPEDFIVKEVPKTFREGPYLIFKLIKREYNTVSAINLIANYLRTSSRQIGFAGNKDKFPITEQYISIQGFSKERVLSFKNKDIQLEYICTSSRPISLGFLEGNSFEVRLKNCVKEPKNISKFLNYFGEQRFSKNNADIGFALIKKDFKKVVDLLLDSGVSIDSEMYSKNDFVGILQKIPSKNISLFISAFQSFLWNKTVDDLIKSKSFNFSKINISNQELVYSDVSLEKNEMPLVGFETEIENSPYSDLIYEVLKSESVNQRDFIIPQLGHLSAAGNFRKIFIDVSDLTIIKEDPSTFLLKFTLPKGCYATVFIRHLFL